MQNCLIIHLFDNIYYFNVNKQSFPFIQELVHSFIRQSDQGIELALG